MKIKKSELKSLIENYIYEQTSLPEKPLGASDYPEYIETDAQKKYYNDMSKSPEKRAMTSKFIMSKHSPIFEDAFNKHIENWRVFSNAHPYAAWFLQLIDITGISGWADLADSIEDIHKPNATVFDDLKYYLNILGALPIGMLFMGSGRIITWIANKVLPIFTGGYRMKGLQKFINTSDDFKELLENIQELKLFKNDMKKITDELVNAGKITKESAEKILLKLDNFVEGMKGWAVAFDTVPARAFFKFIFAVAERLGESFSEHILNFYSDNPSVATNHTNQARKLIKYIYNVSPDTMQKLYDFFIGLGEGGINWLNDAVGLN